MCVFPGWRDVPVTATRPGGGGRALGDGFPRDLSWRGGVLRSFYRTRSAGLASEKASRGRNAPQKKKHTHTHTRVIRTTYANT